MLVGVDEAGRGPLAGPVVAACVGWYNPPMHIILKDSKQLSEKTREHTFNALTQAVFWSVGTASAKEIDNINVRQATLLAMHRALCAFKKEYNHIIFDGLDVPEAYTSVGEALVKADQKIPEVSAASIIAKVFRDRIMREQALLYPQYAFEKHKAYPTALHRMKIREHGLSLIHRKSFCKSSAWSI